MTQAEPYKCERCGDDCGEQEEICPSCASEEEANWQEIRRHEMGSDYQ